jgi:hypothetical protein
MNIGAPAVVKKEGFREGAKKTTSKY